MPHRVHLFSLRLCDAFRDACIKERYSLGRFKQDLLAGVTVGIIAIPLAMALAIASGVPPQYGLYTVVIAGFLISFTGGSRFSISGPTAAFVVILYPITQKYGLGGLLMATVMAGGLLIIMAILRLGRLIEYIPEPVTLGFTGGIGVVIATLQIKDFLGLANITLPDHYIGKISLLVSSIHTTHWPSLAVAAATLLVMLLWPKTKIPVPAHLPALIIGALLAHGLNLNGLNVDTLFSRFSYLLADGTRVQGIPAILPAFILPWQQMGATGTPLNLSWQLIADLIPAAFAIAMLGAIESLLCAVVMDNMTGKRHSANSELLGQGIGNIVAPFFGGITATAAIARSAANFKAGAQTPVAGMIHALVVLVGLVGCAPILGYLPMPAMAALLIVVAWNMSEASKSVHLLSNSRAGDRWVFACCFLLTILFDMVIAITAGIVLAAILFMKDMAESTRLVEITKDTISAEKNLLKPWKIFNITGPLFFAAADKIFSELALHCAPATIVIVQLERVTVLDAGGVSALRKFIDYCQLHNTQLILVGPSAQVQVALERAKFKSIADVFSIVPTMHDLATVIKAAPPGLASA
ncbi:MAG TPA: C4-dicarboxylic acid transporter DauA [Cellvibrionaceae bacterium]